jgi:hypothetical protein
VGVGPGSLLKRAMYYGELLGKSKRRDGHWVRQGTPARRYLDTWLQSPGNHALDGGSSCGLVIWRRRINERRQ